MRPTSGPPLRNSALMLSTASTETAHEGESNQVRIIRKTQMFDVCDLMFEVSGWIPDNHA